LFVGELELILINHNFIVGCGIRAIQGQEECVECLGECWVPHEDQQGQRVRGEAFGVQDMSDGRKVRETGGKGTTLGCRLVFGDWSVCVQVHYVDFESSGYTSVRGPRRIGIRVLIERFTGKTCQLGCDEYETGQESGLGSQR
jgi:hypothetical protein